VRSRSDTPSNATIATRIGRPLGIGDPWQQVWDLWHACRPLSIVRVSLKGDRLTNG
jgi:hypothetical protein